ncbi:MAG TPA: energy transducer TonB [Bryobacteraceae bacterium]
MPRLGGYPLRGFSFAASLGVHSAWIALFVLLSSGRRAAPERPVYDEFIRPYEHKILFYAVPKKTPDVNPAARVGVGRDPRGAEVSQQTVVATSPQSVSKQQTIWLPIPKIQIHQDVQTPDLVARLNVPAPPPPDPPKPRPRAFIPPQQAERQPPVPASTPILSAAAPQVKAAMALTPRLEAQAPLLPAPAPPAAPRTGNANADIAIANLHPTETIKSEIPDGARPGQFSKAPDRGEVATGEAQTAAATIPNLTIRNDTPKAAAARPGKFILYAERLRNVPINSVSVPLRPTSRAIPRTIDALFQGRNVYTMVIPIENLPAYTGDWILWFAEHSASARESTLMRAPIPFRKTEPEQPSADASSSVRVQIAALLGTDGKLTGISVLGSPSPALKQAAVQDATEWEFKPATRDGAPVSVDVVLEIPFNVSATLTATGP